MNSNNLLAAGWLSVVIAVIFHSCVLAESASPTHGFVRILNAVGAGSGNLECRVGGQSVRPEGYRIGEVTGGIALESGRHVISFRRSGVSSGRVAVRVRPDETTMLVVFSERMPLVDGERDGWRIRVLKVGQHDVERQSMLSLISVCPDPELKVEVRQRDKSWKQFQLLRLKVASEVITQRRGYVALRCRSRGMQAVPARPGVGIVVVFFELPDGRIDSRFYLDYRYRTSD